MRTSLEDRIKQQRRRVELTGVLNYLQKPGKDDDGRISEFTDLFSCSSHAFIREEEESNTNN